MPEYGNFRAAKIYAAANDCVATSSAVRQTDPPHQDLQPRSTAGLARCHSQNHLNGRALLRIVSLCLALCFFFAQPQWAQTPNPAGAQWGGVVRNDSGQPVAGATVKIAGPADTLTSGTGAHGDFRFLNVAPGAYTLTVRMPKKAATAAVSIHLPGADVVLTISPQNVIGISVAPAPVSSAADAKSGGEHLSGQAVSELPLNKRDFSTLLLLAAGTMTDANGATNFTQQFAINGQRGVEATFAMDGADISDPEMGGATFTNFNVDAIEEHPFQFRLDAGGDRPRRVGIYQHPHPLGRERISWIVLRVRAQLGVRCAQLLRPSPHLRIRAGFRPSAATSSDSRTAAR